MCSLVYHSGVISSRVHFHIVCNKCLIIAYLHNMYLYKYNNCFSLLVIKIVIWTELDSFLLQAFSQLIK